MGCFTEKTSLLKMIFQKWGLDTIFLSIAMKISQRQEMFELSYNSQPTSNSPQITNPGTVFSTYNAMTNSFSMVQPTSEENAFGCALLAAQST